MKVNNIIWIRTIISIIIITLLCPDFAIAEQENYLAAESRLNPFFSKHGLGIGNISIVTMSAARLKKVLFEKRGKNITDEIEELNRLLSNAGIEIEPGIREYVFRCTRKKVKYVVFNFVKDQKKICGLFLEDHHSLNRSELEEIGVKEAEEHYMECPGLEGIWFVNPEVLTNRYQDRLDLPNKELQVVSGYFNYDFLEILQLHGSIFDVDMFFRFLRRKLKWVARNPQADTVWNLKFICGDSITAKDCRIEGSSFYIEIKEKEDSGRVWLDIRIYNKETGVLLKTIKGLKRSQASSREEKRIESKIDINELMRKKVVFIGENHRDVVTKNWLLRNLKTLKENGVKVIGLEMFDIDYQDTLDAFMRNEAGDHEILDYLDREWGDNRPNNLYLELLKEMRKYGIQPVALRISDSTIAKLADRSIGASNQEYNQYHDRFMALRVIKYVREKLTDGKMLVLLGYQHIMEEDCTSSFVRNNGIDSSVYPVTDNINSYPVAGCTIPHDIELPLGGIYIVKGTYFDGVILETDRGIVEKPILLRPETPAELLTAA